MSKQGNGYLCKTFRQICLCALLINPLNAGLNPIYRLLALLGARHILHVSTIRVKYQAIQNCVSKRSRVQSFLKLGQYEEMSFQLHAPDVLTPGLEHQAPTE